MKIVFDLDGTLADLTHRLHLIKQTPKDWKEFFQQSINDTPIFHMIELNQALYLQNHTIEVWSGRSEIVRVSTMTWLENNNVKYNQLRMRSKNDFRADDLVKEEWLHSLPKHEWPDLVFDDRDRIVQMWRRNGIKCCQVAPGDF
jgi:phosphoglycolate phosphatase-like HAD superfamily hydrolase